MEPGVWNPIPSLGFTSKNDINKHFGNQSQVWYSIPMLVFNPDVGFESQVWYWQWISQVNKCLFYSGVCELGLEHGVLGMEFNSKVGVYKQEWHNQACFVFNPKPNVYYWMVILNFNLVLNAKNSKWVWSGNTTITNRRQPHGTARKSHSTIMRHQEDKLSKATSSLFPIKMIGILEWT